MLMDGLIKYAVGFRISDDKLDPSEITGMLKVNPDKAHRKGDPNTSTSKKGKAIYYSPFSTGLWSINSHEKEHEVLDHQIKSLLLILYPLKDKLAELISMGYTMDMFCGVFLHGANQPGFDISSDTLLKLGELNIDLGVCLYT